MSGKAVVARSGADAGDDPTFEVGVVRVIEGLRKAGLPVL